MNNNALVGVKFQYWKRIFLLQITTLMINAYLAFFKPALASSAALKAQSGTY